MGNKPQVVLVGLLALAIATSLAGLVRCDRDQQTPYELLTISNSAGVLSSTTIVAVPTLELTGEAGERVGLMVFGDLPDKAAIFRRGDLGEWPEGDIERNVQQSLVLEFDLQSGEALRGGLAFMGRYWAIVDGQVDANGVVVDCRARSGEQVRVAVDSPWVRALLQ